MKRRITESVPIAGEITLLLSDVDNPESLRQVMQWAYPQMHDIAVHHLRHERPGRSLQATVLVNEICLRFLKGGQGLKNRGYFFAAVSNAMRRLLVDEARKRCAKIRGGHLERVDFGYAEQIGFERPGELLDFHAALNRLETIHPLWSEVAKLRVFGELSTAETAGVLGVAECTARKRWALARKWIRHELTRGR